MKTAKPIVRSFFVGMLVLLVPSCIGHEFPAYDIDAAIGVEDIMPVVIVGRGPAGLSASVYTCRANFKTLVIGPDGGQLTKTSYVENWPGLTRMLGARAIKNLEEQAKMFGAEFLTDIVDRVDFSSWPFTVHTETGQTIRALSVVIGTGAKPRYLGVSGEEEYWGAGVTACALCDAPLYKGEEVVVIGGGDAAIEEATQLAPYASKVTILIRKGHMRAVPAMQDHLKGYSNIVVMYNVEVQEILGNGTYVTGVRLLHNLTNEVFDFSTNGVFLAIGRIPNSQFLGDDLVMDREKHIIVTGRSQYTSVPGVFAAGDVADPTYRQAGVAAGDGIRAGIDTSRWLTEIGVGELFTEKIEPYFFRGADFDEGLELKHIDSVETFKKKRAGDVPLILDFYTEYCPSCLQMMPRLARVAQEYEGKVLVYKVDADQAADLTKKLSVHTVPQLVLFKNGQELERHGEEMSVKELQELFGRLVQEK